jgi:hypothetical protein
MPPRARALLLVACALGLLGAVFGVLGLVGDATLARAPGAPLLITFGVSLLGTAGGLGCAAAAAYRHTPAAGRGVRRFLVALGLIAIALGVG